MTKTAKSYIIYNGKNIYFTITYKNVKNMTLKVKDTIQGVSPFYVTKIEISYFIYSNFDKLLIILVMMTIFTYFNHQKNIVRMIGEAYNNIVNISKSKSS